MEGEKPIAELGGRTWSELEATRHENGALMFPEELRRRNEKGAPEVIKIRLCVPTVADDIEARVRARKIFRDKELDSQLDADLFKQVEALCSLARAIRTYDAPHAQYADAEDLARYDEGSLQDLQERIAVYKAMLDPREQDIDEARFWKLVAAVGRAGNVRPLADIAGHAQPSCVVRMAREALHSRTSKPSSPSSETSTPAPSH